MQLCSFNGCQLFTMVVAISSIVTVLIILFLANYPTIAKDKVIEAMVFRNDSNSLVRFRTTKDIPSMRMSFYLYNITNAADVINSSAKINLQEIGPFVYAVYKYKEFVDNNQTSGLITYKLRRRFNFDRSLSIADPKQVLVTWPNVPLLAAKSFLDSLPTLEKMAAYWMVNDAISNTKETPFIQDTVDNFLFNGSKRILFEYLRKQDIFKSLKPWPLKHNRFGLLYGKNDSWNPRIDRTMTISTGFGPSYNYHYLNQLIYLNGSSTLPFWGSQPPSCNHIGGTDGQFFSPFLNHSSKLDVFSADICRKVRFSSEHDYQISGIKSIKYSVDKTSLQSGIRNPGNQCYCIATDPNEPECKFDGLIDLSRCVAPNIIASGAHFIHGSPELLDRISGISPPDYAKHDISIYIEPNTGITIKEWVPFQFNVKMQKNGFNIFKFFQDQPLIVPLVWALETSEITDNQAFTIKATILLLDSWLITMVLGGAIVLLLVVSVLATVLFIKYRDARRNLESEGETDPLIQR